MTQPRYFPLEGYPEAWTPSTRGVLASTPVYLGDKTAEQIKAWKGIVQGFGPAKAIVEKNPDFVKWAHAEGLTVTPYTFTTRSPAAMFKDVSAEMGHFLYDLNVDALFTDNPDKFPRR